MRIYLGGLSNETNSFGPMPAGADDFAAGLHRRADGPFRPSAVTETLIAWRDRARAEGHEAVEGFVAYAHPSGLVVRAVYERLRDDLLAEIAEAGPLDAVLLQMHGAMAAQGRPDCEGDVLARVRSLVGPDVAVGLVLDLHCQVTRAMLDAADILIANKEYPHTDTLERAQEVYALALATRRGEVRPRWGCRDTGLIGFWPTGEPGMRRVVDGLSAMEREPGVLSVTLAHGFPWGDIAENSARALVYVDGDAARARMLAHAVSQDFFDRREALRLRPLTIAEGLDRALAGPPRGAPVVIADMADNSGGGAASDSTFVLEALLARDAQDVFVGGLWDPGAAAVAFAAGEGARLSLRIGGKVAPTSGAPLDLEVTVEALNEDLRQSFYGDAKLSFGRAALVRANGVRILLVSRRIQLMGADALTGMGLDPRAMRVIVVKSSFHFRQHFAPLAADIVEVNSPGTLRADVEALPYVRRTAPFWPRDAIAGPPPLA